MLGTLAPVAQAGRQWGTYVAAALLASLTIRVFFELQDYGPESAVRRFYEAVPYTVKTSDMSELKAVSTDEIQGRAEIDMILTLAQWEMHGVPMQIVRLEGTGNEARVVVAFSFPTAPQETVWTPVWVVQRRGKSWRVDVSKTAAIFWDARPPQIRFSD